MDEVATSEEEIKVQNEARLEKQKVIDKKTHEDSYKGMKVPLD